jgi:hypothetical protein
MNNEMNANESTVSRLAYQLWENAGRPANRDLEFWLAAENKLRSHPKQTVANVPQPVVAEKAPKASRSGTRKTWPKPYPALPKF